MGLKKLAEETISESLTDDAYALVAQTEEIDGSDVNVVRRVPVAAVRGKTVTFTDPDEDGNIVVTIN